jgi:hypothetical protein
MTSQQDNRCMQDEAYNQEALMKTLAGTTHHFFGGMAKYFSRNCRPA